MALSRRRFQTAELMQKAVDEYFLQLEYDLKTGEEKENPKPPTMTGLARYLGFSKVESLRNYENYPDQDFQWVINDARMRVMEAYEEKLHTNSSAGAKFALSNMDRDAWKERSEQVVDVTNRLETKEDKKTALAKIRAQKEARIGQTIELEKEPDKENSWI